MKVSKNTKITFHYTVKLEDNTEVDSSGDGPITITLGKNEILGIIEDGLVGMKKGEKKTLFLTSDQAFGDYDMENIVEFKHSEIELDKTLAAGNLIDLTDDQNNHHNGIILEKSDEIVKIDFNHPLAGKDLYYEIKVHDTDNS